MTECTLGSCCRHCCCCCVLQEEEHQQLLRKWKTTLNDLSAEHAALKVACRAAERVRDAARSLAPQRPDGIELPGALQVLSLCREQLHACVERPRADSVA
jgi:hypothetical protein